MRKCEQDEVVVRQTSLSTTSGLVELNRIYNLLFPRFLRVRQDRRCPRAGLHAAVRWQLTETKELLVISAQRSFISPRALDCLFVQLWMLHAHLLDGIIFYVIVTRVHRTRFTCWIFINRENRMFSLADKCEICIQSMLMPCHDRFVCQRIVLFGKYWTSSLTRREEKKKVQSESALRRLCKQDWITYTSRRLELIWIVNNV